MKNVLITGFDPFGGETTNPSFEAVNSLPDEIKGIHIVKKEIPTEFYRSKDVLLDLINQYKPIAIINVGQAGGRNSISIERYAFNMMDASIPDNAGNQPKREIISVGGAEKIETVLDFDTLKREIVSSGIPCVVSESAGLYVCNYVMYTMLLESKRANFISGFIHVPYSKEQVKDKKQETPYLDIEEMTKALEIVIEQTINSL